MEYNIYSSQIDNNLSKNNKNYPHQNEQQKSHIILPESLKVPIQLLEQNNFDKFNSYISSTKIPNYILNSLLCFCLQNYSKYNNIIEQIKLLISKGADINIKFKHTYDTNNNGPKLDDKDNISLLMYACTYNDKKLVELFITKNNINYLDKNGKNALFYLFTNTSNLKKDIERANIIRLLIKNGININCAAKVEKGNKIVKHSPLSLAATYNLFYSFKELLNNGADLNFITEPNGDTILHIAVKKINHEMIKLLLNKNNIKLEEKNKEGKTARDLALEIEPDSIIYNLIVEKISESDNIDRKKSDELSFDERSKKDFEVNDINNNICLSSNYLIDLKEDKLMKVNSIKNENNKKDNSKIKTLLKNYNNKKKDLLHKHIKEIKKNSASMKLYVSLQNEEQKNNSNNNNNVKIDKIIDYITLENDENQRPCISIDLLSKKFLNYKNSFVNNNNNNITKSNNNKAKRNNLVNKITFMNNNIDKNINININNDISKKNEIMKLEDENSSLKKELEKLNLENKEIFNENLEKNKYILKLEKNNSRIELLNLKINKLEAENEILNSKIKNLEKEKESLNQTIKKFESQNESMNQLQKENDILKSKTKELEKENESLNLKIKNFEAENSDLKQNNFEIKKEYSELNQKMENALKEKENEKLNKINSLQTIKSNQEYYSQYLNNKFTHFNYEKEYIYENLSSDLSDFEMFVKFRIEKEKDIYDSLIKNVQDSVDKSIPDYEVNLYGSHATNLCLPWSDLDVVLIKKDNVENDGNQIDNNVNLMLLSKLYEYIRNEPWVKDCKLISKASVPIIKLITVEKFNNMSIDISIQDDKHFGLKCVELVKKFIDEYKSLKPLVLAIKNILKSANLNDPYKGGISSYGLILMIIFFLQKQKTSGIDISPGENYCNLGKLFFDFIKFYAIFFESNKVIININDDNNLNNYNEYDFHNMGHSYDLIIVDPLNKYNNVAKSCLQFFNIKMSFIICLMTLQEDCICGCHYSQLGENNDNHKEKHCFLKRLFNCVKRIV